jgi:hypothetical protein
MKRVAQIISALALAGTLLPPCLLFAGQVSVDTMQTWMLVAALAWLVATPLWMEHTTH